MSDIYTLGIDVGSTASKCIILKNGCEIVSKSLIGVGAGTSGPERAIKQVLDGCGMKKEDMAYTLATGYGRNSLMGLADQQMSELSCHAKGATFLFPDVHTVIDIGGQDVKILHIENGAMVNFAMNDKCAAGTGRFLDVMARVLEVRVDDLDKLGALSHQQHLHGVCRKRSDQPAGTGNQQKRYHCRYSPCRCQPCCGPGPPHRRAGHCGDDRWCGTEQRRSAGTGCRPGP